jgi:hypothetical protein
MKKCKKCGIEKELINFNILKIAKDGLRTQCKQCEKEYRDNKKDKTKKYLSEYYKNNKKEISNKNKERYNSNKERYNENRRRKYNDDDNIRKEISKKGKEYRLENKDKVNESKKKYYENNKEYIREWKKNYYNLIKDLPEYKEKRNKNMSEWSSKNKHIVAWRNSLKRVIYYLNIEKCNKTIDILGYSADEFRIDIESKFLDGMTWDNWGEWHIDHIIPVSKFDKDTHPSVVNSLSNLQPLWAKDNFIKRNT